MIKNIELINPLKREKVLKGVQFIDQINKEEHIIDKVVVFGSSICDNCSEDSDIDLCLYSDVGTENNSYFRVRSGLANAMGDIADILSYKRLNDNFKKIVEQGVVVYE